MLGRAGEHRVKRWFANGVPMVLVCPVRTTAPLPVVVFSDPGVAFGGRAVSVVARALRGPTSASNLMPEASC